MSRRLEWARSPLTFNTLNTVLTSPAATKLELVQFSLVTDATLAVTCLLFNDQSGTFTGLDSFVHPAGLSISTHPYNVFVLQPGESLVVFPVSSASLVEYCVMQYVEVEGI